MTDNEAAEYYAERLDEVVSRLHNLAERVAMEGRARRIGGLEDSDFDFLHAAGRVLNDVTWGVANLHLETLLSAAADAYREQENRK
jgi:predicted phage-related endonuclease